VNAPQTAKPLPGELAEIKGRQITYFRRASLPNGRASVSRSNRLRGQAASRCSSLFLAELNERDWNMKVPYAKKWQKETDKLRQIALDCDLTKNSSGANRASPF
jgi:hypothetical protein